VPTDPLHDDLISIWERVSRRLQGSFPTTTFQLWIEPLRPVSAQSGTLYLAATDSVRAWVERRYASMLEHALRDTAPELERVALVSEGHALEGPARAGSSPIEPLPLHPTHTFERFVIGDSNRIAHAAALAVAELPGEAYNPLFLHGTPGLGKTHLLGAIAHYLRRHRPDLTVHYTTAERFTTEFVGALRKQGPEMFKRRYRKLDALLIDDVQILEGKELTQEEVVHTFNALHAEGKQIVLSSDRPPEALAHLAERLRDRFGWGLCVELTPPDLHTRTVLLWRIATEIPLELGEADALAEIASRAVGNVRHLEGAITRVTALSSVLSQPVTASLVRRALPSANSGDANSSFATSGEHRLTTRAIQEATCSVLEIAPADLLSSKRTSRVTAARHLAIYLTRDLTTLSLAQIARDFNRDHSTILHATRAVAARLTPGSETEATLQRIRALLPNPVIAASLESPTTHDLGSQSTTLSTGQTPAPSP
jgi:chromosomal replication initiator protein